MANALDPLARRERLWITQASLGAPRLADPRTHQPRAHAMTYPLKPTALLALLTALLLHADPALACLNGVRLKGQEGQADQELFLGKGQAPSPEQRTQLIAGVERHVQLDHHVHAIRLAHKAAPELRGRFSPKALSGFDAELARGARYVALATVRYRGRIELKTGALDEHKGRAKANLAWATSILEASAALAPDDPERRAHLAEALATSPKTLARARAILAELAERDLIPSPHGWAALAKLHAHAKATDAAAVAHTRCMETSSQDAALCAGRSSKVYAAPSAHAPKATRAARGRASDSPASVPTLDL